MKNDFFKHILLSSGSKQNRTELETETLPYTFTSDSYKLRNYRIYGNTVNGESVGDRTGRNLFDKHLSVYGYINTQGLIQTSTLTLSSDYIPIIGGENYTIWLHRTHDANSYNSRACAFYDNNKGLIGNTGSVIQNLDDVTFTIIAPNNAAYFRFSYDLSYGEIMFNSGSTAIPYEPCGYQVPVTVTNGTDTETTNIYLPAQIKIIGNETEYVDFRTQKQYFADGTFADVALPALPTFSDTNVLSVGTTVQPSKVYLQGKISEAEIVSAEAVQANIQNLQPLSLDNENAETDVMLIETGDDNSGFSDT